MERKMYGGEKKEQEVPSSAITACKLYKGRHSLWGGG